MEGNCIFWINIIKTFIYHRAKKIYRTRRQHRERDGKGELERNQIGTAVGFTHWVGT